jgi:hypothetical protein
MNRTQRLMASVAAVVALFGKTPQPVAAAASADRGEQTPPAGGEQLKTSSAASQAAADAVFPKLDVPLSKALSLDELQKLLPKMNAKTIQAGLDRLIYDGKIRRIGDGTAKDPYKYYRYQGGGG